MEVWEIRWGRIVNKWSRRGKDSSPSQEPARSRGCNWVSLHLSCPEDGASLEKTIPRWWCFSPLISNACFMSQKPCHPSNTGVKTRAQKVLLCMQVLEICFPEQTSPLKEQSLKVNHKLLFCWSRNCSWKHLCWIGGPQMGNGGPEINYKLPRRRQTSWQVCSVFLSFFFLIQRQR